MNQSHGPLGLEYTNARDDPRNTPTGLQHAHARRVSVEFGERHEALSRVGVFRHGREERRLAGIEPEDARGQSRSLTPTARHRFSFSNWL